MSGVEINPYLTAIANDTKDYLELDNMDFINSSFEEFNNNIQFDLIFSLANDSTIDDNTKFNFQEYMEKIKKLLINNGILIFESQAIDSMLEENFKEKLKFLENNFEVLENRKISSEYPANVPYRDFLVLRKLNVT